MLRGIFFLFCENNDHDMHYFDFMADTAGYGGRNLAFVCTYTFRMKSLESFINETPGVFDTN